MFLMYFLLCPHHPLFPLLLLGYFLTGKRRPLFLTNTGGEELRARVRAERGAGERGGLSGRGQRPDTLPPRQRARL